jgi:hypothetical protein
VVASPGPWDGLCSWKAARKTGEGRGQDREVSSGFCALVYAYIFIKLCKVRIMVVLAPKRWFGK